MTNQEDLDRISRWVYSVTLAFLLIEWRMFELLRMPYRPPDDMSTFLGTEKYQVMAFMALLALGWIAYLISQLLSREFRQRERLRLTCFLFASTAFLILAIFYPPWPVTPWERICQ